MTNDQVEKVLIAGKWINSTGTRTFQATNPTTGDEIARKFPVSVWEEVDSALEAASLAFEGLRSVAPEAIATFLETYADLIAADKETLVRLANEESGLPASPRLGEVELPRTISQLKQAANACRTGSWGPRKIKRKKKNKRKSE